jgi:IS30 family transposase
MGKRGPQAWEPNDDERRRIRLYAGLGMTQEQIAVLIGKSVDTLGRRCREDLDVGLAEAIAKVAGSLVQKALGGDTTCAIFYLKTQAGWKETSVTEYRGQVRHTYDLDRLSDERLDALEAILADAATSPVGAGEEEPSSLH